MQRTEYNKQCELINVNNQDWTIRYLSNRLWKYPSQDSRGLFMLVRKLYMRLNLRFMRNKLKPFMETRSKFYGTFEKLGQKSAFKGPPVTTLLFLNIEDSTGKSITDHLWFNMTKEFEKLSIKKGDKCSFFARASPYKKGYWGDRWEIIGQAAPPSVDLRLSRPTKIKIESLY